MEAGTKFIGINPNVNTVEKKSAQANSPTEVYTIEEIRGGYKSFVGYFTTVTSTVSYESLTVGDEYIIIDTGAGADFTNVGAANNDFGTKFTATGADPTSWGDPNAVLLDISASQPSITENFNSLGFNVSILADFETIAGKSIVGIELPSGYNPDKVFVNIPLFGIYNVSLFYVVKGDYFDINIFNSYPIISDVSNQPIEIRIYE